MKLFMPSTRDVSSKIVCLSDPHSLIQLSLVNTTAHKLVQIRCLELIRTTEIIPGFSFGCIQPLVSPLCIYTHLVCPILNARENFQELHPEEYIGNFLTKGRLLSGNYINSSPLAAAISYGCPDLFERLMRIRFGADSKEYNQELEYIAENEHYRKNLKHRHGTEITTEAIFKEVVSEYDRLHIIDGRYYTVSLNIAKAQKINILIRWTELFPASRYSYYSRNCGQLYADVASYGSGEMMSYLLNLPLNEGTSLADHNSGFSLMHNAAAANNIDMVRFLYCNQFDLERLDKKGMTPFCVACEHSAEDTIRYFLKLKAADSAMASENKSPTTPLTCLLFSEENLESPLNTLLAVDMILAGEQLTNQALNQLIARLIFKDLLNHSMACPEVPVRLSQLLDGLENALTKGSIPENHAIALQMILTQYLALEGKEDCHRFVDASYHVTELLQKVNDFLHGHLNKKSF
jgi:hypothetical protein